jgi:hypothetical protein
MIKADGMPWVQSWWSSLISCIVSKDPLSNGA